MLIGGWYDAGWYHATADNGEILEARKVVLVDDKALSFAGLPANCAGYWLCRHTTSLDSQVGGVSGQVTTVLSLKEVLV